ncbi:MAG: hypothetical protein ACKN94_12800 [Pirellulaceae bacterium]
MMRSPALNPRLAFANLGQLGLERDAPADRQHGLIPQAPEFEGKGVSMVSSRRERIEAMLREEPGDVFLRYALAMELSKEGRQQESLDTLGQLTAGNPPYVPAYFQAARQLVEASQIDAARKWLRDGIEEARRQGDFHAAGEMSELLSELGVLGGE